LLAPYASADEITDRTAIRSVIAALNDSNQHASVFAATGDASSELARLRQLHPTEFRIIGPPEDSLGQTKKPSVIPSRQPWGEASIQFIPVRTPVNHSVTFVAPDIALAEGAFMYRDTSAAPQLTPLLFVMKRESDGWKIAELRILAPR
jgi:hypothetical protein